MKHPLAIVASAFALLTTGGVAAADATVFNAEVTGHTTKPAGCPDDALVCVAADVTGFGPAAYSFSLTSTVAVLQACGIHIGGDYTATVSFTLGDGSTLTLDEAGTVCGPGNSLLAPGGRLSYGNPVDGTGTRVVRAATGQFASLTGAGEDTFRSVEPSSPPPTPALRMSV